MTRSARVPPANPLIPAEPTRAEHCALTSLMAGNASEGQQKLAIDFILNAASRVYDQPFRAGGAEGARATDFAAGMMFVGQQIIRAMKLDPNNLEGPAHGA